MAAHGRAPVRPPLALAPGGPAHSGLRQLLQLQQEQQAVREQHEQLRALLQRQQLGAAAQAAVVAVSGRVGFERVQRSAAETLARMFEAYITQLAQDVHDLAELTGRAQPSLNDLDVVFARRHVRLHALRQHVEQTRGAPQLSVAQRIPLSRQLRQVRDYDFSTELLGEDDVVLAPSYVPAHLPPFPPRHSFIFTPMDPTVEKSEAQLQKQKCDQRRQVEAALFKLMAAGT